MEIEMKDNVVYEINTPIYEDLDNTGGHKPVYISPIKATSHKPIPPSSRQTPLQTFTSTKRRDYCPKGKIWLFGIILMILIAVMIVIAITVLILIQVKEATTCYTLTTNDDLTSHCRNNLILNKIMETAHKVDELYNITYIHTTNDTKKILKNGELNTNLILNQTLDMTNKVDEIFDLIDVHITSAENDTKNIKDILQKTGVSTEMLMNIFSSLTNHEAAGASTYEVVNNIQLAVDKLLGQQNKSFTSCKEIFAAHLSNPTGYYVVNSRIFYCNMGLLCGSEGGWTRLAYLDMTDTTQNCPQEFRLYESGGVRACGRQTSSGPSSATVTFPSYGISYSQVCGRVIGYQYASPDGSDTRYASYSYHSNLNSYYSDGVSITMGSPRQHVWTLMGGVRDSSYDPGNCPCSSPAGSHQQVQSFVGSHYFCESGNPNSNFVQKLYTSDPLWDGQGCGSQETNCCSAPGLPWFHRDYGTATTTDYLELRVIADQRTSDEDVPVSFYEIYVK